MGPTRSRSRVALLVFALLVAGCGDAVTVPSASLSSPSPTPQVMGDVQWEACPPDDAAESGNPELRCATIVVPKDYAHPELGTITLALAMLPATNPVARVGPLLLNFGGPGASGVTTLADNGRSVVPTSISSRFDLVTWDPRGTGRSAPVDCLTDAEMDVWAFAPGIPVVPTSSDWAKARSDAIWFAQKCEMKSGTLLPYIGTTASARDMESIRAALGLSTLDYLGYSYGTALGAVYATLFPHGVGHLILDGAVDPVPTDASEYGEQGVSIQGALNRLFQWCDANAQCPFGHGASRAAFDALMAKARRAPIDLGDGRTLTPEMIWTGVIMTLYNRDYWEYAVQGLASAAGSSRDGSLLAMLADSYIDRGAGGHYLSNIMEAFPAIGCIDHPTTDSIARYRAIYEQFKRKAPDFASGQAAGGLLCGVWPAVNADPLPATIGDAGAPPILVIGTTGDPATPYAWSQRLATMLKGSLLLTYVGEGHTAIGGKSGCIDAAATTFLVSGVLPGAGTRCQ